jgi:hypothetical protein
LVQADELRLLYALKTHDGTKIKLDELVPFVHTATQLGGRRRWLMCIGCGRGCRKIHGGRYLRCRKCQRLRYRLHDLWKGKTKAAWDFPPKPPRMRWATYQRLLDQYDALNNRWGIGMMSMVNRLNAQLKTR